MSGSAETGSSTPAWRIDPLTLRPVVVDEIAARDALDVAGPVDRVFWLGLLGDLQRAEAEARRILESATDRLRVLVLLADVLRLAGRADEAEPLYREALDSSIGTRREAVARQHLGKQRFDQGRLADAAEQFAVALAARQSAGAPPDQVESSRVALERTRALLSNDN